jgi:hypothetical protein
MKWQTPGTSAFYNLILPVYLNANPIEFDGIEKVKA